MNTQILPSYVSRLCGSAALLFSFALAGCAGDVLSQEEADRLELEGSEYDLTKVEFGPNRADCVCSDTNVGTKLCTDATGTTEFTNSYASDPQNPATVCQTYCSSRGLFLQGVKFVPSAVSCKDQVTGALLKQPVITDPAPSTTTTVQTTAFQDSAQCKCPNGTTKPACAYLPTTACRTGGWFGYTYASALVSACNTACSVSSGAKPTSCVENEPNTAICPKVVTGTTTTTTYASTPYPDTLTCTCNGMRFGTTPYEFQLCHKSDVPVTDSTFHSRMRTKCTDTCAPYGGVASASGWVNQSYCTTGVY